MKPEFTWHVIRFRLLGDLHVGARKWGFVRSGRGYLPGWTLWGALTNFLKRSGRINGTFESVGDWLNQNFWIGHLMLCTEIKDKNKTSHAFSYLPVPLPNNRCMFQWTVANSKLQQTDFCPPNPMTFRNGVVRQTTSGEDTLGNLFLTETISGPLLQPFYLEGWVGASSGEKIPLEKGDMLRAGGSRTAGGAMLYLECFEEKPSGQEAPDGLTHLRYEKKGNASGLLERIVLRRTLENSGKGFGGAFVDWGLHLSPGWVQDKQAYAIQPFQDSAEGWRHGVVANNEPALP